jgi:hydrophobe/amphiphile efflux-1 (HAE1) family protein
MLRPSHGPPDLNFFISRPIFASAIALIMMLAGAVSMFSLPISHFPGVVPPQVLVSTQYIGASADVVEKSVTIPLEEQLNGAEGMIYMSSSSTNNGDSIITATFDVGYDQNLAQMELLSRVNQALPELPTAVQHVGVSVEKTSMKVLLVINLISPNGTYDSQFLHNYADIHIVDPISRIAGIATVDNQGLSQYAMRIWLDPLKLNSLGLTATDVETALLEQNQPVAAGTLGRAPAPPEQGLRYQLNTKGRLVQASEFEDVIVRAHTDGSVVRLRDVARVEFGSDEYDWSTTLSGKPTASLVVTQLASGNGLDIRNQIEATLARLSKQFPEDVEAVILYDSTRTMKAAMREVVVTLVTAIGLVLLVIFLFLQNVRSTLIPMIAVPVSLIGTFAAMPLLGFSINMLSLLGLVVAVALVVDDAIVVVENVNRRLDEGGRDLRQVTADAMKEVRGPILATTLVLIAVFVPVAFIPGLTGRLYNQFSLTIAVAVALSGFNSLTLSPALCASLLRPRTGQGSGRFDAFNRGFERVVEAYASSVEAGVRHWRPILLAFVVLCAVAGTLFVSIPKGFLPMEDQGALMVMTELPAAATIDRTQAIVKRFEELGEPTPGVANFNSVMGYNLIDGIKQPNTALTYVNFDLWPERTSAETQLAAIHAGVQAKADEIPGARITVFNPPAILGLGSTGGFAFQLQDLNDAGPVALAKVAENFIQAANARPELSRVYTTYNADSPQRRLVIDRVKAKTRGVSLDDLFDTLEINLGSRYVNQFNRFGRVYWVYLQAEAGARSEEEDIGRLKVRNADGEMINLSAFVTIEPMQGPYDIQHYDLYPSAEINGGPAPGYSTGQAVDAMEALAAQILPDGYSYQWTDIVFQQKLAGGMAPYIFALSLVFVFLVLAAQYESWVIPVMILLSVPLGLLGAVGTLTLRGMDLDVLGQIGLIVLIGLVAKNAILIVSFAQRRREAGASILEAATEAARLRLRPILMTAFAFIIGLMPLVFATGGGANARRSLGSVVVGGLVLATLLIIVVPVFYSVIERWRERGIEGERGVDAGSAPDRR